MVNHLTFLFAPLPIPLHPCLFTLLSPLQDKMLFADNVMQLMNMGMAVSVKIITPLSMRSAHCGLAIRTIGILVLALHFL